MESRRGAPRSGSAGPFSSGLSLAPFRGVRPTVDGAALAARTSPPSDSLDDRARARLRAGDDHNVVRLILPRAEADHPDPYGDAARMLACWRAEDALRTDDDPALYVYALDGEAGTVRGFLGALELSPVEAGVVLPHEDVMPGPVAERLALTRATGANFEPLYCLYDGGGAASQVLAEVLETPPLATAGTPDGIHRLWAVTDPATLAVIADDLHRHRVVIADGHHRYATYLEHQAEQRAAGLGPGPWDRALTFLVDVTCGGTRVGALHRVVPGLLPDRAADLAAGAFRVTSLPGTLAQARSALAAAAGAPAFLLTDGESHHLLTDPDPGTVAAAVDPTRAAAWRALDVTLAHAVLVRGCWGLDDGRTPAGHHGLAYRADAELAAAEARLTGGTALLLNPASAADVLAVAEAGERMPRKSTLFSPKPVTGMVLRCFDTD